MHDPTRDTAEFIINDAMALTKRMRDYGMFEAAVLVAKAAESASYLERGITITEAGQRWIDSEK